MTPSQRMLAKHGLKDPEPIDAEQPGIETNSENAP